MNYKTIIKFILPLCVIIASCAQEAGQAQQDGYIQLSVVHDLGVEVVPVTKSEDTSLFPIALQIVDSEGNIDYQCNDFTKVEGPIRLLTGRYTAKAWAGTEMNGEVSELPFYSGSAQFEVKPNAISNVDLVCGLASVKVTARVDDQIKANFEYTLEVTNGRQSVFFYEDAVSDDKVYYFPPTGRLTWTMHLTNSNNEEFVLQDSYVSVKARQYYALSFSLQEGAGDKMGASDIRVIVDNALNDPKIHDLIVVIDKSAPTIVGEQQVNHVIGDKCSSAAYVISSKMPFGSIVVSHSDMDLVQAGLPQSSELYMDDAALATLKDSGVGIAIFADGTMQTSIDATTTDVRLDFSNIVDRLPVGEYRFTITALNANAKTQTMEVVIKVSASLGVPTFEPWAKFVYVKGTWVSQAQPAGLKVQYRLSDQEQWIDFVASDPLQISLDQNTKTYRMFVCGLNANSEYKFRVVSDLSSLDEVTVRTESAAVLDNMNFDNWIKATSSDASKYGVTSDVWYPNANFDNFIWDTANGGTATIGKYPTEQSSDAVIGSAVKMTSLYINAVVLKSFAAGNIYTGKFDEAKLSLSDPGAELDWGVRFTGRPLALMGYYKYAPKLINKNCNKSSSYDVYLNTMDKCQIQVGLFEWDNAFHVNTQTGTMVDFTTANNTVVAYTKYESDEEVSSFRQFVVPFEYRRPTTKPTYIIVTACSSYLGDYFVGGEGSQLWVDEFSFVYDPMEPEFAAHRQAFFNMFK